MKLKPPTLLLAAAVILTLAFFATIPVPEPQRDLTTTPAITTTTSIGTDLMASLRTGGVIPTTSADYTPPGPVPTANLPQ